MIGVCCLWLKVFVYICSYNKIKINLETSSNIEGILPIERGGIGKNNLQEAFNE